MHRDVEPSNPFLVDAGGGELRVEVRDFGLAKAQPPGDELRTATGTVLGSPRCTATEQRVSSPGGERELPKPKEHW